METKQERLFGLPDHARRTLGVSAQSTQEEAKREKAAEAAEVARYEKEMEAAARLAAAEKDRRAAARAKEVERAEKVDKSRKETHRLLAKQQADIDKKKVQHLERSTNGTHSFSDAEA